VTIKSSAQVWLQQYLEYRCDDCGHHTAYRSRSRTFSERYLLPVLLLQPVRCGECFRRDYCLLFTPVKDRRPKPNSNGKIGPSPAQPDRYQNVA
jgi:DNA-directed RNA polymerase subunit RPC12/RpoP